MLSLVITPLTYGLFQNSFQNTAAQYVKIKYRKTPCIGNTCGNPHPTQKMFLSVIHGLKRRGDKSQISIYHFQKNWFFFSRLFLTNFVVVKKCPKLTMQFEKDDVENFDWWIHLFGITEKLSDIKKSLSELYFDPLRVVDLFRLTTTFIWTKTFRVCNLSFSLLRAIVFLWDSEKLLEWSLSSLNLK